MTPTERLIRFVVLIPVVLFSVWSPRLFRGDAVVPRRSRVLLGGATALGVVWFIGGWKYGLKYEGPHYTYAVCAINLLWIAVLAGMLLGIRKKSSYAFNLAFHWMLFAWLSWYAFPYLGELP
jgi:hypothetical protein